MMAKSALIIILAPQRTSVWLEFVKELVVPPMIPVRKPLVLLGALVVQ